jgi:hypothetical protein
MILPLRNGLTIVSYRQAGKLVLDIVRSEDVPTDNPFHAVARKWLHQARKRQAPKLLARQLWRLRIWPS